jgi:hypothetical protein
MVALFSTLVDCVARLETATAERPELARVHRRLLEWRDMLLDIRDRAITKGTRRGHRRDPSDPRRGDGRLG